MVGRTVGGGGGCRTMSSLSRATGSAAASMCARETRGLAPAASQARPPPPSLPYKVDTSRPSLRTKRTRAANRTLGLRRGQSETLWLPCVGVVPVPDRRVTVGPARVCSTLAPCWSVVRATATATMARRSHHRHRRLCPCSSLCRHHAPVRLHRSASAAVRRRQHGRVRQAETCV